ncbi:glycoside hydrolase family 6 protein [Pseudonocardia acidicola]|nr:glycoside hydrolase family 6 protein [Pseudonocardia acidicola]
MARTRRVPLLVAAAAAAVVVLAGAVVAYVSSAPEPGTTAPRSTADVVAPSGFFVDPQTAAAAQVRQWQADRPDDAAQIRKIADRPFPLWVTGDAAEVTAQVRAFTDRAAAAGQRPLLVAYNIPHRDCGSFSGGGAPDGGYYRTWTSGLVAGLAGRPATVVLEPDAVPHEISGCVDGALRDERYVLLGEAVDALKGAGATVYLDAGNPGFISDTGALAGALQRSGIGRADGFSLNVANFFPTPDVIAFGTELSDKLGGAHFVIDTSRNGQGRLTGSTVDGAPSFCNPPGRGLGEAPTTQTGNARVDALLWIKRPGESDGACRPGEPSAGQWWPEYALGLARRSVGS